MPLRGNRAFSLLKSKKDSEDACILRNVRPIDDSEIYSTGTLGRVTCSDTALPLLRERAYSLTNPSKALWGSGLKTPATDYNSNPTSYDSHLKNSYSDIGLVIRNEAESDSIQLLPDVNDLQDQADITTDSLVLKPKNDFQNKPKDIVGDRGKVAATNKQKRTITEISGPICNDGAVRNHIGSRFPSLEDQQKTLLLLADSQQKSSTLNSTTADEKRKYFGTVKSSSLDLVKDFNTRPRSATAGSKMAGKIQRTIRALYDGNGEKKMSVEKAESDTDSVDEIKLKPTETKTENISPKPDKRSAKRSRSPKPMRRANVPTKDVDGSRRFKWRGSVNRIVKKFGQGQSLLQGATFDVLLEDCPPSENNELVPFVVDLCCRLVEQHGLAFTGIYRVPGNSGTLAALQEELNQRGHEAVDLENDDRFCDLNIVSSLLKSFFRKLPDPLFTNELYDDFIAMNRRKDPEERLNGIRRLIHMLPAPHYETLKFLVAHLRKVSDNSEHNKAFWLFCDDEETAKSHFPELPAPRVSHEEPNLDHLLANVGRTTDDVSDTASESSRSKVSITSEKESFSRDVMDSIFGSERQWTSNPHSGKNVGPKRSSDDEENGEFKFTDLRQTGEPCLTSHLPPSSPRIMSANNISLSHQTGKSATTIGHKGSRLTNKEHLPLDYNTRLKEFYFENMEWLTKSDINRSFSHFSSSSAESSPQVTPRTSIFGLPQPSVQRIYPKQHCRRLSEGRLSSQNLPQRVEYNRQSSTPLSSPLLQRNSRSLKENGSKTTGPLGGFRPSNTIFRDARDYDARSMLSSRSRSEVSSRESLMADVESDSDTSIFIGDSLEEKLRNLTNLNKKVERRPSRRQGNGEYLPLKPLTSSSIPLKPINMASQTVGNLGSSENLLTFSKKSSQELYQERKAQRQQHRGKIKVQRSTRKEYADLSRCTSDENVYNLTDQLRTGARTDVDVNLSVAHKKRLSADKLKRRHTLGSGDFPDPSFWENSHSVSLQNITRDVHDMTLSRLRPQLRASAPSLFPQTPNTRLIWYGVGLPSSRSERTRKVESHI